MNGAIAGWRHTSRARRKPARNASSNRHRSRRKFCRMRSGTAGSTARKLQAAAAFRPQHHRAAGIAVRIGPPERREIRRCRHRRGVEQQLHVRQRRLGAAPEERHLAGRQIGGDALAAQIGFGERRHDAVEPHRRGEAGRAAGGGRRCLPRCGPAGSCRRPAARTLTGDAVRAQFVGIADAGQHQHLRRVDDAAAQDDFAIGMGDDRPAVADIFDADRRWCREKISRAASALTSTLSLRRPSAGRR